MPTAVALNRSLLRDPALLPITDKIARGGRALSFAGPDRAWKHGGRGESFALRRSRHVRSESAHQPDERLYSEKDVRLLLVCATSKRRRRVSLHPRPDAGRSRPRQEWADARVPY